MWGDYSPERFQVLVNAHPEYGETPQCETDRDIVHDGNIQVSTSSAKVALVISAGSFHDQTGKREKRLDLDIFYLELRVSARDDVWKNNLTQNTPFEE